MLVIESDTAAGLQAELQVGVDVQSVDTTAFYVIESVQYQVVMTKEAKGNKPAEMKYSALIWASQALKV